MRYFKNTKEFVSGKAVFCGIDVHNAHWDLCFICDDEIVEKIRLDTNYVKLKALLLMTYSTARIIKIVYEAGFSGFWLYRSLVKDGYQCTVTPPSKIPAGGDRVKTDRRDAQKLAAYHAAGLLKSVAVPPENIESDRRVCRKRRQLSKDLTRVKNRIKSFLALFGISKPRSIKCSWSRAYHCWLDDLEFEYESDRFTLDQLLKLYRQIRTQLAEVTRFIRNLSRSPKYDKNFSLLTSLRGVGLITAITFLLEVFDFKRFANERKFASYLGFTPIQHSSGEKTRLGHITRQGNAHLRNLLVESAWTVIRYEPLLLDKYNRIKARGTNGKKAIVAVARSLAIRLRRCLLEEQEYVIGLC
jgi:transposase